MKNILMDVDQGDFSRAQFWANTSDGVLEVAHINIISV